MSFFNSSSFEAPNGEVIYFHVTNPSLHLLCVGSPLQPFKCFGSSCESSKPLCPFIFQTQNLLFLSHSLCPCQKLIPPTCHYNFHYSFYRSHSSPCFTIFRPMEPKLLNFKLTLQNKKFQLINAF